MEHSEQINPIRKYERVAVVSFGMGLVTVIFPTISIFYLITENGGSGYVQSLFCGIPFIIASIITGIAALVQLRRKDQKGVWMAILGIVFGILYMVIFIGMVFHLLSPFLIDGAGRGYRFSGPCQNPPNTGSVFAYGRDLPETLT
jgi:hypothetical protein